MQQYTEEQIQAVKDHCLLEVEARQRWACGLSPEFQRKLPMELLDYANYAVCVPIGEQVERMFKWFETVSHRLVDGELESPDLKQEWDAATAGRRFEGHFSHFSNAFPATQADLNYDVAPPGF